MNSLFYAGLILAAALVLDPRTTVAQTAGGTCTLDNVSIGASTTTQPQCSDAVPNSGCTYFATPPPGYPVGCYYFIGPEAIPDTTGVCTFIPGGTTITPAADCTAALQALNMPNWDFVCQSFGAFLNITGYTGATGTCSGSNGTFSVACTGSQLTSQACTSALTLPFMTGAVASFTSAAPPPPTIAGCCTLLGSVSWYKKGPQREATVHCNHLLTKSDGKKSPWFRAQIKVVLHAIRGKAVPDASSDAATQCFRDLLRQYPHRNRPDEDRKEPPESRCDED